MQPPLCLNMQWLRLRAVRHSHTLSIYVHAHYSDLGSHHPPNIAIERVPVMPTEVLRRWVADIEAGLIFAQPQLQPQEERPVTRHPTTPRRPLCITVVEWLVS